MKKFILIAIVFLNGISILNAQNTIEVEITNFTSDNGIAQIGLFNSEISFLKNAYKRGKVAINNRKAVLTFKDIPDGIYAISVFHDKNEDEKLNTDLLGIPKEPYGVSNNAKGTFGPPKWKDAKFEVRKGEHVTKKITL